MSELKVIPSTDSQESLPTQETPMTLSPLSKNIAELLLESMKEMHNRPTTPQTVSSICECASELHKLMRLNWEMRSKGLGNARGGNKTTD